MFPSYGMLFFIAARAAAVTVNESKPLTLAVNRRAKAFSFLSTCLGIGTTMKEIERIRTAVDVPFDQPIVVRREIGNIVMKLLMPGDVENGKLLTRNARDEIYSVAQPVYSSGGKHGLWQYDMAVNGTVKSITLTAAKNMGFVVAGVTVIE